MLKADLVQKLRYFLCTTEQKYSSRILHLWQRCLSSHAVATIEARVRPRVLRVQWDVFSLQSADLTLDAENWKQPLITGVSFMPGWLYLQRSRVPDSTTDSASVLPPSRLRSEAHFIKRGQTLIHACWWCKWKQPFLYSCRDGPSHQIIKRLWLIKKIRGCFLSIWRIDLSAVAYK